MINGRCALVTGSTGGLGYAIAQGLAADGCNVALNGFGDRAEIETRRKKLEETSHVRVIYHDTDLADPHQIEQMARIVSGAFGAIDIVVNNAVVRHFAPVEEFLPEHWNQAIAVNLSAAFHTIRLALPGMRKRNFGRIVNISSVYGLFATVNRIDYVTTKTALIGLTRAVALETAGQDITCNAVCPGSILTPYSEGRLAEMIDKERISRDAAERKFLAQKQPSGRFVSPENVAALVSFLCGPKGRDVTGAAIPMDAGWSAA